MDHCEICKEEILEGSKTKLTMNLHVKCFDRFHNTCMVRWLKTCHDNDWRKSCPLCRRHWENCTY